MLHVYIIVFYAAALLHIGTTALTFNKSIELYPNINADKCLVVTKGYHQYTITGQVTKTYDLISVGFQTRKANSNSFNYNCIINFSETCKPDLFRLCYCTFSNNPDVYNIVLNTHLQEEDSNGKVRAVMLLFDKEKTFSNEIDLPSLYNPTVDKVDFHLEINDQPVNTEKCLQTITSDTLKIQHNATSTKGFPFTISILDEDTINELKENVVQMYILRAFERKVELNIIFKVQVCSWDLININCILKNAIHNTNNEINIIISVVVSVTVTLVVAAILIVIKRRSNSKSSNEKKKRTKSKNNYENGGDSVLYQAVPSVPATSERIQSQHTGLLNIFKEYNESEHKDEALEKVSLLLIGKLGNGKSATGNTILGKTYFTSTANPSESEQEIKKETTTIDGKVIEVVDGPSISGNIQSDLQKLTQLFNKTINLTPEGFDAVILIFRFGLRYTSKDDQRLFLLKLILGEYFVSKRCIVVITGGDNFKLETEEDSILNWCMKTDGLFRNLVEECEYRLVLFDNKTSDVAKIRVQVKNLLDMIDTIRPYRDTIINLRL